MGIFDVFKKKSPPPAPIRMLEMSDELPQFPELPELPSLHEDEHPEFHQIEEQFKMPEMKEIQQRAPRTIEFKTYPETSQPEQETSNSPIFISSDDYRRVLDRANVAKEKLIRAEEIIHSLGEIKIQEEKEFERWKAELEKIEQQLSKVESMIARAEV